MKSGIKAEELRTLLASCDTGADLKELLYLMLEKIESQEKEIASVKKQRREIATLSDRLDIVMDTVDLVARMALGEDGEDAQEEADAPIYPKAGEKPVIGIWDGKQ